MEITGKIKVIDSEKQVGATFKKRDIVITTDETYPQHIQVQFVQDKCDLLNGFNIGEAVTVGINLRGREWTNPKGETVYFNTIQGWKISRQNTSQQSPEPRSESAVDAYETKSNPQEYPQAPANSHFGLNSNNLPHNTSAANEEAADDLPF